LRLEDDHRGGSPDGHPGDQQSASAAGSSSADAPRKAGRTGRNLPAALGVALVMGGLVLLTLLTIKWTFLVYVGIIVAIALWELAHALASRDIHLPLVPIAGGGAAMVILAYLSSTQAVLAAMVSIRASPSPATVETHRENSAAGAISSKMPGGCTKAKLR